MRRRVDEHKNPSPNPKKQSLTIMLNSIRGRLLLPTARRVHGVAFLFLLTPTNPSPSKFLSSSPDPHSQALTFLIDSCGLSPESAIVAARKLSRSKSPENPSAVLRLFRDYSLGKTHVSRIIAKYPILLSCDSRRILRPKLEAFQSFGFSGESLARVLSTVPVLLTRSLERHIVPCFSFLRTLLAAEGDLVSVFTRHPHALNADLSKTILPILGVLRKRNLPEERIPKLVKFYPRILITSLRRVNEIVDEVESAGVLPSDLQFIYAFRAVARQGRATWDRKMAVFQGFGLSEADVLLAFRRRSWIMALSEEKIRRGLEFFLGSLKLAPDDIVRRPILLCYSLEKRVLPRCAVMSVLKGKGKLEESSSVVLALLATTSSFLEKYVMRYQDDVPEVLEAYKGEIKFKG